MEAGAAEKRHPLRTAALVATALAAVVAIAAIVLVFWLRAYAPLSAMHGGAFAPGSGLGADVEPTFGSGGKPVFIPAYRKGRPFDTTITLVNNGRFAVTLLGLPTANEQTNAALTVAAAFSSDVSTANAGPSHLHPLDGLRLEPHDTAIVDIRWRLNCDTAHRQIAADSVRLRYRYLSFFTRSQAVELPFAVTLRCVGGPPASP
jgi:hypothetical protein